jgi:hypothetical protein
MAVSIQVPAAGSAVSIDRLSWSDWRRAVLTHLRAQCPGVLQHVRIKDVDWTSWRSFYTRGFSPRSAVDCALERDF